MPSTSEGDGSLGDSVLASPGGAVDSKVARGGLTEKVTFKQRPVRGGKGALGYLGEERIPGKGNSQCKGPEVRLYFACLENSKKLDLSEL